MRQNKHDKLHKHTHTKQWKEGINKAPSTGRAGVKGTGSKTNQLHGRGNQEWGIMSQVSVCVSAWSSPGCVCVCV